MMTDDTRKNFDDELAERLRDPAKRLELWQWMNPGYGHNLTTPSGMTQSAFAPHLTPSGTNGAEQPLPPFGGTFLANLPGTPAWWIMPPYLPFFTPFPVPPTAQPGSSTHLSPPSTPSNNSGGTVTPQPWASEEEETHEEDRVEIHDNDEANLFAEFDPTVESPGTCDPLLK